MMHYSAVFAMETTKEVTLLLKDTDWFDKELRSNDFTCRSKAKLNLNTNVVFVGLSQKACS